MKYSAPLLKQALMMQSTIKRGLPCLLPLLFFLNSYAGTPPGFSLHFRLLPQPQKIEFLEGRGVLYSDLQSISLVAIKEKPIMNGILANLPLTESTGTESGTPSGKALPGQSHEGRVSLEIRHDLKLPSAEGYVLEIRDRQIIIKAEEQAGLFYGVQTLEQLLEDSHDGQIPIPSCRITDYPQIPYRAVHLDMKHHVETGRYYYHIIDQLASIKINAVIVEFEDKLRYRKAPLVGSPDAISIEEFAAISRYAKERNIEISPLVQGLGHASFILKHDAYKDLRDDSTSDWVFDPLNPKTYDLQFSLYEDAIAATPYGKYLHVGGDEVGALGKSELAIKSGMKPIELQLYWLKKVTDFAKAHHRIPIFWDDMVFKLSGLYETTYDSSVGLKKTMALWKGNEHLLAEKIPLFPKDCIYMRWNYGDSKLPGNLMALDWYKAQGLNVMGATAAQCMSPMLPRDHSNFDAIKGYCQLTAEKGINGILCTVWDDCSPHFETVWRGLYDFALFSWHYQDIDVQSANELFRHRFYGPQMASGIHEFQDLLEKALPFWETALLEQGDRNNYHKDFALIGLPDKNKPGAWSVKYKDKLMLAAKAVEGYHLIGDKIKTAMGLARRNGYALSVMNQINELQVYPANLLLLLQQYDNASPEKKTILGDRVRELAAGFQQTRTDFEKVYSETRILGNPEDYLTDSNFHNHLANGTNNTDWMYVYELAMNKKISDWGK